LPKRYRRLRARHRKFAPHCPNSANRKNTAEAEQDARERDRKASNDRAALETNRNIIIIGFLLLAVLLLLLLAFEYQTSKLREAIIAIRTIAVGQSVSISKMEKLKTVLSLSRGRILGILRPAKFEAG
jgi:hypothetical protein